MYSPRAGIDVPLSSRRLGRRLGPIVVLLGLTLATAGRAAAEADRAETLIRQAIDLRRAGDDQKAYRLFNEAYGLSPSPRSAGQLGFCEQALGSWVDAETHLGEALRGFGDPWIKKNRTAIEHALVATKAHIARVEVTGDPVAAEVLINGSVVGKLPLVEPARVAAGQIEIELRAPGFARITKNLRVEGGQYHKIQLHAEREKAREADGDRAREATATSTSAPTSTPPAAAAELAAAPRLSLQSSSAPSEPGVVASSPAPTDRDQRASGAGRRSLKFVSWGLGVIGLGVGVYGIVRNGALVSDFDSGCGLDANAVPRASPGAPPGFSDSRCADLKRRYEQASTVGIAGFVAGGVLVAAGFVLWATEPSRTEAQAARWTCAPAILGTDRPQLACAARF